MRAGMVPLATTHPLVCFNRLFNYYERFVTKRHRVQGAISVIFTMLSPRETSPRLATGPTFRDDSDARGVTDVTTAKRDSRRESSAY